MLNACIWQPSGSRRLQLENFRGYGFPVTRYLYRQLLDYNEIFLSGDIRNLRKRGHRIPYGSVLNVLFHYCYDKVVWFAPEVATQLSMRRQAMTLGTGHVARDCKSTASGWCRYIRQGIRTGFI